MVQNAYRPAQRISAWKTAYVGSHRQWKERILCLGQLSSISLVSLVRDCKVNVSNHILTRLENKGDEGILCATVPPPMQWPETQLHSDISSLCVSLSFTISLCLVYYIVLHALYSDMGIHQYCDTKNIWSQLLHVALLKLLRLCWFKWVEGLPCYLWPYCAVILKALASTFNTWTGNLYGNPCGAGTSDENSFPSVSHEVYSSDVSAVFQPTPPIFQTRHKTEVLPLTVTTP